MEMGELLKEYESIPKCRPTADCAVAQMAESADKNRFQDVLPYDDTRVELVPTKENNTGYINASHIKVRARAFHREPKRDKNQRFDSHYIRLPPKSSSLGMVLKI